MASIQFARGTPYDFIEFTCNLQWVLLKISFGFHTFCKGDPWDFTSIVFIHFARGAHCDFIVFHCILQGLLLRLALAFHTLCKGESLMNSLGLHIFCNGHPWWVTSMVSDPLEALTETCHDWLAGWLITEADWLAGWLAAWLAGWLASWLPGWLAGCGWLRRLTGWLAGWLRRLTGWLAG